MRKILLVIFAMLYFTKSNAQVNNLKDLLELSGLSVSGLTDYLQYTWTVSRPTQFYRDNKTKVTERYTYVYDADGKSQILARAITVGINDDYRIEVTDFVSNEKDLLHRIKKNLPYQGYELIEKESIAIYSDGNTQIFIQEESTEERTLSKGYYAIVIQ